MPNRTPRGDLARDLHDPEFARLYGAEEAKSEFGAKFGFACGKARFSQTEIEQKLKISHQRLREIERGEANPRIGEIGAWLAALGYTMVIRLEAIERTGGDDKVE